MLAKINDKNARTLFGAELLNIGYKPGKMVNSTLKSIYYSTLSLFKQGQSVSKLSLKWMVRGTSNANMLSKVDNLIKEISDSRIACNHYEYRFVMTKASEISYGGNSSIGIITIEGDAVKQKAKVTGIGSTIVCLSTVPNTDVKLTTRVVSAAQNFILGGVTIPNVFAGDVIEINSIDMTVKKNGLSVAHLADFTNLPRLSPGTNTISCSQEVILNYEYYPTYY